MYLIFDVLGYFPTNKIELISQTCPSILSYIGQTKAYVYSSFLR